jgi:EpsI family protein
VLALAMACTAVAAEYWRPTYRLAEHKPRITLDTQVPTQFGDWRVDTSMVPILPDPGVQRQLDMLYSQVLARTYINSRGERVMLTIAYGSDQGSEATQVHRPEFCYSAQGFRVAGAGVARTAVGGAPLTVQRLVARLGRRNEPITYWVTLDESATLPGLGRKLRQMQYGVRGQIPDGMLVRVSSISGAEGAAFALQERFIDALYAAVPGEVRARYFGAADQREDAS